MTSPSSNSKSTLWKLSLSKIPECIIITQSSYISSTEMCFRLRWEKFCCCLLNHVLTSLKAFFFCCGLHHRCIEIYSLGLCSTVFCQPTKLLMLQRSFLEAPREAVMFEVFHGKDFFYHRRVASFFPEFQVWNMRNMETITCLTAIFGFDNTIRIWKKKMNSWIICDASSIISQRKAEKKFFFFWRAWTFRNRNAL